MIGGALVAVAVITTGMAGFAYSWSETNLTNAQEIGLQEQGVDPALETIHPEIVSDASSFSLFGIVLSNETANIYPRRDGIVEDIFVDVGDEVKKGQVVALLLPKGVEGQSSAMIAERQAQKSLAESEYGNIQQVARETIQSAEEKIAAQETELQIAIREQDAILKNFELLESKVVQIRDKAFVALRDSRQFMERLLIGSNASIGADIRERDIHPQLGTLSSNNIHRYDIVPVYNDYAELERQYMSSSDAEKDALLNKLFVQSSVAFQALHDILAATPSTPYISGTRGVDMDPATITVSLHGLQNGLLSTRENWENARLTYEQSLAKEPELAAVYTGRDQQGRSKAVQLFSSQLTVSHTNLQLLESQQKQMIDRSQNSVDIAAAMLRTESAQSGHRQIQSPFSGVVSKRFLQVGEQAMQSRPAFELVGVQTTLSKQAKAEIEFGLPENLIGTLSLGDELPFTLASDESKVYLSQVSRLSPQVDTLSRTVTVRARIDDGVSLPSNASVRVHINGTAKLVYRIPSHVVKRIDDANSIWVLDHESDQPTPLTVEVISEDGEYAEVIGDISEETRVLLHFTDLIRSSTLHNADVGDDVSPLP